MSEQDLRTLRRRRMHERQAVVFGVLLAGLAVSGLGAAALYTESMSLPFLQRPFSVEPTADAAAEDTYCPPEGALPVPTDQITVDVYNGGGLGGLAAQTGALLAERGFAIGVTENAPASIEGVGRIIYGAQGSAAAYTLHAYVPDAVLQLDTREDARVDLVVGSEFGGIENPEDVIIDPASPLVGPPGCIPFSEIAPPDDAPAEGEEPAVEGEEPAVEGEGEAPAGEGEEPAGEGEALPEG